MAEKRCFDGDDEAQLNQKRMKTRPSFASVIREVVMVNFFENFCSVLEPMLRRVVSEEVENGVRSGRVRSITIPRCLQEAQEEQQIIRSCLHLQLRFGKRLSLPIFTGTKIVDKDNNPLQIILVNRDIHGVGEIPTSLPNYSNIKVEIVVLDGDFNPNGEEWSKSDFEKSIVKERSGKRPLLTGDIHMNMIVSMKDTGVGFVGDIEFTDNSSWIRSRKFKLGARVVLLQPQSQSQSQSQSQCVVIREAITEPFVVKDHRGELYKKHHPPALEDEVWRLEKIGKGGAFHQKLASQAINSVHDFLKLFIVDSSKLRRILGVGMSDKMWEATLKHAKTCVIGTKLYRCHGNNYTLILNPICQLIKAQINGQVYSQCDFKRMQTAYIESLVKDAYANWNLLEEVDGLLLQTPLLTQGEMVGKLCPTELQLVVRSNYVGDDDEGDNYCEWAVNSGGF